jgi:hypothetical protein
MSRVSCSPFQPNFTLPLEADSRSSDNDNDNTFLAHTIMVPDTAGVVGGPRMFHPEQDLLISPLGEFHQLTANHTIRLIAWRLSGVVSIAEVFRQKLSNSSFQQQGRTRTLHTSQRGMVGVIGTTHGTSNPCLVV